MNRLDSTALDMAERHIKFCHCPEQEFIDTAVCVADHPSYKVPFIQRQAFAERTHYFWLCLTRGIEPCS
jgi:hypothetical protein